VSGTGPIELPLADREVWRVDVSRYVPFLRIEFLGGGLLGDAPGRDLSLTIEGRFSLETAGSVERVDPDEGPNPVYLRFVEKRVSRAIAGQDGSLRVEFADGDLLMVEPAALEPWQLESHPDGLLVVSVAGGGLAVWGLDDVAAASEGRS
jgi:hypothetical protein